LLLTVAVVLTVDEQAELRSLVNGAEVPATVATRARIVLWHAEKRQKQEIAALAGVSRPTVDLWLARFQVQGVAGLLDRRRGAPREQVSAAVRARILAVSRTSPPAETGLSHWSSREMAAFIKRTEGVYVSHHYVAKLWRDSGLRPHRQGTFKRAPAARVKRANAQFKSWKILHKIRCCPRRGPPTRQVRPGPIPRWLKPSGKGSLRPIGPPSRRSAAAGRPLGRIPRRSVLHAVSGRQS
jgi:transposase